MRRVVMLIAVVVWIVPGRSRALFGEEDWLSGQNALLAQLLSAQLEELYRVSEMLANIRMVTSATNESLAIARETYRAYRTIRSYSLRDLMRDAKRGLYRTFPDLQEIERDGILIKDQVESGEAFFSTWNRYDTKMSPTMRRLFEHSYQATIWPAVFPEAMELRPNMTPVEMNIWKRYAKTRQDVEVLVQKTSLAALMQKAANFVKDAEESGNLEVAIQAATSQAAIQQVANSTEMLNLYKAEVAIEEEARERERKARDAISKAMKNSMTELLMPGTMKSEP